MIIYYIVYYDNNNNTADNDHIIFSSVQCIVYTVV
jgi:hypothetical protein